MQENEFEDELGKNMEGFGIEPSANVWPEVERRIPKEKKRRFAFWFWFLLLLLAGGIGTAILFNQENKNNNKIATTKTKNDKDYTITTSVKKDSSIINGDAADDEKIKEGIQSKKNDIIDEIKFVPATNIISTKNSTSPKQKINLYKNNKPEIATSTIKIEYQKEGTQKTKIIKADTEKQPEAAITDVKISEEKTIAIILEANSETEAVVKIMKPLNLKVTDSVNNELALKDSISNPTKNEKAILKLKKWSWGLQFSAGKSGFSKSLFSLNNAINADLSYSSPGTGSSTVGAPSPSPIKPSLALSAGLFIKKPISKNLGISIGINYHYLSTHRSIGTRVDSTREVNNNSSNKALVSEFYRPATVGNSTNYTNQFHFIGLQADVAWKIISAKKVSIYWENGIAYNHLVSSNMLHYSSSLPGYYKDNSLLNKNQLSFSTGLLLPIEDRFMIKPFLNYNLTSVFKHYSNSNLHFSTYGLQLKYIFKK